MLRTLLSRLAVVLTVIGLTAAMAMPAGAERQSFRNSFNVESDEVICDIPVHVTVAGFAIDHIQEWAIPSTGEGSDNFWIGVIQVHAEVTFTNADGVAITNSVRQTIQEGSMVDNGDGTWTYTYTINGLPAFVRTGNGQVYKDVGRITFQDVIYLGDLSTTEDNEFVSQQILGIQGPHPEAESGFALFCEVFTDTLG